MANKIETSSKNKKQRINLNQTYINLRVTRGELSLKFLMVKTNCMTTSHIYQWPLHLLTNQIAHQGFRIFNWLRLHITWLPHRLLKHHSQKTVLLRTPITQMILFNQGMLLQGSNHFLMTKFSNIITLSTITSQFNSNQGQNSTYFYEFLLFCTCVQDLSWETTLSLVQTQEFCVSLYHALQQELLSQWPWMQKISLFPRKHDQLLNIDYQQILYVPNMQVNRNENALIAPLPKTTSVHQSNHVQNVFAFHIN